MVTVHSYKRWDINRDVYVTTRLKGTPQLHHLDQGRNHAEYGGGR